jgi:Phosphotransferase enzyme family
MAPQTQPERTPYRLIITRRRATEILLSTGSICSLPSLEAPEGGRLTQQFATGIRQNYGLETYCLWAASDRSPEASCAARYAVMEAIQEDDKAPAGMTWTLSSALDSEAVLLPADHAVVRSSLEELHSDNPRSRPFGKPGWIESLFGWVDQEIRPLGLHFTGKFQQLNASPTFSLIRMETTGTAMWFKATGEPNAHELSVSVALARLFPNHVPRIVGVHLPWNAWLSEEVARTPLDQTLDCSAWERAAEQLAELQIASIGKTAELMNAHAKDLRIRSLQKQIDPFLARMSQLMAAQEKQTPRPLFESELRTLAERLKESFALLEHFGLPDTLGQIDMNPGNILVSDHGCAFLDWAEASVTHPFVTFEYLREHLVRRSIEGPAAGESLTRAYLRPWTSLYSPKELARALALSPLIAVFIYAVADDSWRSRDLSRHPKLPGYFRALTRRMYREAIRLPERGELCLQ